MVKELQSYESVVNKYIVNVSKISETLVPEKHFRIMNSHFSHYSVEMFLFPRDHNICLVYLHPHGTWPPPTFDIRISEPLANVYCLELDE